MAPSIMPSCSCTTSSRRCGAPPPAPYTTPLPAPALRSSAQAAFSGRSIAAESSRSPSHPGTSGRGSYAAPHRRATGPPVTVVRTSEHWWEDEEEFDALTEMLAPKRILISTGAQGAIAQGGLQGVEFATCLTAEATRAGAEELWAQLGQGGPPYFKKVRARAALDKLEGALEAEAAELADAFWKELLMQSWRVELDYGLEAKARAEAQGTAAVESLLVVCPGASAAKLLAVAGLRTGGSDLLVVDIRGWNADGKTPQPLQSWRQLVVGEAAAAPVR